MDENDELEEGELLEDEEERRRKNKSTNRWKNDNPERFNKTSYEKGKQQRNSGILRTAIAAITSNSAGEMRNQKRRPSVEDEEELLRQHLLKSMASQENRSNAKQAKKANLQQQGKQSKSQRLEENEASTSSSTIPMAQNATSSESNAADDIENLTQALLDAKRKHSELMERKQTIQQSLITCEADLELAGQEVSNLIERISTAWSRQFNSLNPQKVEKPEVKINAENEKMEEENNNHQIPVESSTTIPQIAAVEQQDKGGDTGGGEENTIQIAQIPVEQQQKSGVTKNMGEEENPTTNISFSEPIQPTNVNDVEQQSKIAQEDEELEDGQIMDETIEDGQIIDQTMEEEMAQTQTNIIIEENLEQRKDLAENNANQMEEVENRVEEMREIADNRSQQFDPFLVSIRSYRLSPLFPQGLISHPAISNRLNPYIPLCPYQLDGRCADRQCPYQHEEDYLLSEQQIIEEIIGYWPKICPNGMQPSEYAANLLANGPFDQVVGFLISRMPDSIRIGGQKQPFQMKSTAKTKPNSGEDDRVEYESILNKALNFAGNTITIQNQIQEEEEEKDVKPTPEEISEIDQLIEAAEMDKARSSSQPQPQIDDDKKKKSQTLDANEGKRIYPLRHRRISSTIPPDQLPQVCPESLYYTGPEPVPKPKKVPKKATRGKGRKK